MAAYLKSTEDHIKRTARLERRRRDVEERREARKLEREKRSSRGVRNNDMLSHYSYLYHISLGSMLQHDNLSVFCKYCLNMNIQIHFQHFRGKSNVKTGQGNSLVTWITTLCLAVAVE